MAALTGLPLRAARDLVASEDADDRLWIANINAVDQVVLGGTLAAMDDARQGARRAGARASRCSTSPSHRTGHCSAIPQARWHNTFQPSRTANSARPT